MTTRSAALPTLAVLLSLSSCSPRAPVDPAAQVRDQGTDIPTRVAAVDALWRQESARTDGDRAQARESLKSIAWAAGNPGAVRIRAIKLLADDPADPGQADTRNMLRLLLLTEPNMDVIRFVSGLAADGRWAELTPSLVRSYSRKTSTPADAERPERAALLAIHPGRSVEQIAYQVFVTPVTGEGTARQLAEKAQQSAWELLSRLDRDGSRRAAMLAAEAGSAEANPTLAHLRACASDLQCIPLTALQLEWLLRLRAFDDPRVGPGALAWWDSARAAVAALPAGRRERWALRNVEPLRWAAANRPDLVALDRAALLARLRESFRGRRIYVRGDQDRGGAENFAAWADALPWGDLLTLAIIDEAVRAPAFGKSLAEQVARDRLDTSTELGGVIQWVVDGSGGRFVALLYPPRATQRPGDHQFVASDDLLADGAWALAHYHFHVQRDDNREYAGPGPGDREYAEAQGRACVVFTTVRGDTLNADYYQAGGVVVDLGEVRLK